jgi:hypothetical protein
MPSVEQLAKANFARVFVHKDWRLFKTIAEFHLENAARLRKSDMKHVPIRHRLLARNSQKRLSIGVGTELLLKALYLKHGFVINKPETKGGGLRFPFTVVQAANIALAPASTYMLNDLIQGLSKVGAIGKLGPLDRGLKIAKVFRNKEGHVVLNAHIFNPQDYREIEQSLVQLYLRGFDETLRVRFAFAKKDRAIWRVS